MSPEDVKLFIKPNPAFPVEKLLLRALESFPPDPSSDPAWMFAPLITAGAQYVRLKRGENSNESNLWYDYAEGPHEVVVRIRTNSEDPKNIFQIERIAEEKDGLLQRFALIDIYESKWNMAAERSVLLDVDTCYKSVINIASQLRQAATLGNTHASSRRYQAKVRWLEAEGLKYLAGSKVCDALSLFGPSGLVKVERRVRQNLVSLGIRGQDESSMTYIDAVIVETLARASILPDSWAAQQQSASSKMGAAFSADNFYTWATDVSGVSRNVITKTLGRHHATNHIIGDAADRLREIDGDSSRSGRKGSVYPQVLETLQKLGRAIETASKKTVKGITKSYGTTPGVLNLSRTHKRKDGL